MGHDRKGRGGYGLSIQFENGDVDPLVGMCNCEGPERGRHITGARGRGIDELDAPGKGPQALPLSDYLQRLHHVCAGGDLLRANQEASALDIKPGALRVRIELFRRRADPANCARGVLVRMRVSSLRERFPPSAL